MVASEASLVVDSVIRSQFVDQINSFLARHTFLGCACKRHDCTEEEICALFSRLFEEIEERVR